MPLRHDPDCVASAAIQEAIRIDDQLAVLTVGKFGELVAKLRQFAKPATRVVDLPHQAAGGEGVCGGDVVDNLSVGRVSSRREADAQLWTSGLAGEGGSDDLFGITEDLFRIASATGGNVSIALFEHGQDAALVFLAGRR